MIRQADKVDLWEVARLCHLLAVMEGDRTGPARSRLTAMQHLINLYRTDTGTAFVAEEAGRIRGCLVLEWWGGACAADGLFVEAGCPRRTAHRLMGAAAELLLSHGVTRVWATANGPNVGRAAYRRLGFTEFLPSRGQAKSQLLFADVAALTQNLHLRV